MNTFIKNKQNNYTYKGDIMKTKLNRDDINNKYLSLARQGDSQARDIIINNNMPLVGLVAKKYINKGCEWEDLLQIGSMGLMKAMNKFDISFNVKFSTYAVPLIIGEIKRFMRDDGVIKISRSVKYLLNKINYVRNQMREELDRNPTITELAIRCEATVEDVSEALQYSTCMSSLQDEMQGQDDSIILRVDTLDDKNKAEVAMIDDIALKMTLNNLSERHRTIIYLRYYKDMTQSEIANILNMSQVSISRHEKLALKKMKSLLIAT